jgi:hypothetical protein
MKGLYYIIENNSHHFYSISAKFSFPLRQAHFICRHTVIKLIRDFFVGHRITGLYTVRVMMMTMMASRKLTGLFVMNASEANQLRLSSATCQY